MTVFKFCAAFKHAQKLCEILLHWGKVHFIQAYEERNIRVKHRFNEELHKRSELIMRSPDFTFIAEQFGRVVPIRFDLDKAIIAGRGRVRTKLRIIRATIESHLLYDSTLSCARNTRKQKERLCPHRPKIVKLPFCIIIGILNCAF